MAIASAADSSVYKEIINPEAKGETLSASLNSLLEQVGGTLADVKRVLVTLGPGSFSGLRTGVAFCQGLCFSGARKLYGATTLQALACFSEGSETAVVTRARNGYWYLRLNNEESFISTEEVLETLSGTAIKNVVADEAASADETLSQQFKAAGATVTLDTGKPLSAWGKLFNVIQPSLIQEANYIQPSYFEKLNK